MLLGNTGINVSNSRDGLWYKFPGEDWKLATEDQRPYVKEMYDAFRSGRYTDTDKQTIVARCTKVVKNFESGIGEGSSLVSLSHSQLTKLMQDFINFFSEFNFEPNFRFTNTFAHIAQAFVEDPRYYIESYFELIDSPFTPTLREKMKSPEFEAMIVDFRKCTTETHVNKRFKLYYGSQGTGKTTKALEESEGLCMVCHSAMLPQDLMEDFTFNEGKAEFKPSVLQDAIVNGKVIVLDEINLLPFESLRFLQSILDGKEVFTYKGNEIKVADGFKIIGTMNLVVNGCVYSLPEPLIDRAEGLKKFELTASALSAALI